MSVEFDPSYTKIRRSQKAILDEQWIIDFLKRAPVGVLATVYQDQPFLSTKLFVYDQQSHQIYMHAADEGRVMQNVSQNPKVCFTVYEMGRFLPAPKARSFGVEYKSVIVFGRLEIVQNTDEILKALRETMQKYAPHFQPGKDYPEIQDKDLKGVAVYRLVIAEWSAKADLGVSDHPGAYRYEEIALQ